VKEDYSAAARKDLALEIDEAASQGDVFVYFKHEETPEGALHAEALLAARNTG